jgi:serine/threonine protein kinase/tetratricopeptide (TPR) repeat protein
MAAMTPRGRWDVIQELFDRLVDLPEDERARGLVGVDADVAAEVRSLLEAHRAAGAFLGRTDAVPASGATTPNASDAPGPAPLAPGAKLGPYRLVEEIGHGGMGIVFRATRDDDEFTRDVAVKLIDPGRRSDDVLRRFRAERQILAMLDHPHIARLVDGGTAPDGSPYLVMDYVAGRPLLDYCDHHRLGIDRRLDLFLLVCDAVQFAHQRLVVHRDLKSDNILVTDDGNPRLLDFGIARLLTPDEGLPSGTLTLPMQRMLTPDYASPEQVRGEPVTVAGDVYSLGVILYELLCGARPHRFRSRSPEEIVRVVTEEDPLPPSAVVARAASDDTAGRRGDTTRRLRRRIAGDLDNVVLKCLAKDPTRRYGAVDQLARDVRRHLAGEPVSARGHTTTYLLSRFVRRHRVAVVSGALVFLALLAGLAGTIWQAREAALERDRAHRRFNDVRALARAVVFDIHDAIANLPGSTKAREVLVGHALRYLDELSRDAGPDDAELLWELGTAYGKIGDVQGRPMFPNLGRSEAALASYDRSLGLLEVACAALPDSARVLNDLLVTQQRRADLLATLGRHDEAITQTVAAMGRARLALTRHPDDILLLRCLLVSGSRLADMRLAEGDTAAALALGAENGAVSATLIRLDPADPENRRSALIAAAKSADLLAGQGRRAEAAAAYREGERLAREAVAALPNNTDALRDLSVVYGMFGLFYAAGGDIDSALLVYDRGMRISEELAAADPDNALMQSDVALGHLEIGTMLSGARRFAEAEREYAEAHGRFSRLASIDTSNVDVRVMMARAGRRAGEACAELVRSGARGEAAAARHRGVGWFTKSLALYRDLAGRHALIGEEESAPAEVAGALAALERRP